jgi:hypothetical protein
MPRVSSFASIVAIAILSGCSLPGPVVDRSTFFALAADATPDGTRRASLDVAVGLGPVTLPGYLDRPQLVRRVGPNELRLAHDARWAEPLREGIVRILQQDILVASGARSVTRYPWSAASHVDLAVAVDVLRFEAGEGEDAELVARWTVRELPHGRVVAVRDSRVTEPVDGSGTGAEVAALSQALGGLAREIAVALHGARKHP